MAISGAIPGNQAPAGGLMSSLANDDHVSGMRIAIPIISSVQHLRAARDAMYFSKHMGYAYNSMAGGYRGGMGTVGAGLRTLPGLLKSNFLISGAMSIFTNLIDMLRGKTNGSQFLANTVADTVAYTAIGTSATMIGGMIGSIIPGLGTIVGMGIGAIIGFLGGKLYEDKVRPSFTGALQAKFAGVGQANTGLAPTPPTNGYLYNQPPAPAPAWPR